jgi:aspartate aminotransferase
MNFPALAEVLDENSSVLVLCDDIYEHIIYRPNVFATLVEVEPRLKERTLTINGVPKAYAMKGWRIGYAGDPNWLIAAMTKRQGQSITNPSSVSQAAAVAALEGKQVCLRERREICLKRRNQVVQSINAIDGLSTETLDGGFYLFACCEDLLGQQKPSGEVLTSDTALVEFLLEASEVAFVLGSEFGLSQYFHLCFAGKSMSWRLRLK